MPSLYNVLMAVEPEFLTACLEEVSYSKCTKENTKETRKESKLYNLRTFHNWIKRQMLVGITSFIKRTKKQVLLMDIAVGKGGDISKWNQAGITGVFGFDINAESITEANNRIKSFKPKWPYIEVMVGSIGTDPVTKAIPSFLKRYNTNKFDIVSCQFAIHYFNFAEVFSFVKKYIAPNGYFCCTCMYGDALKRLSKINSTYGNDLFSITFEKDTYNIQTFDTPGNYVNNLLTEKYVMSKDLISAAKDKGLSLIKQTPFEPCDKGIHGTDPTEIDVSVFPFMELYEKYNSVPMTLDEKQLNNLYVAYIFQNTAPGPSSGPKS
jgi:hypothetical protein